MNIRSSRFWPAPGTYWMAGRAAAGGCAAIGPGRAGCTGYCCTGGTPQGLSAPAPKPRSPPAPCPVPKPIVGANPPRIDRGLHPLHILQQQAQRTKHKKSTMQIPKIDPNPKEELEGTCNSKTWTPEDGSITPALTVMVSGCTSGSLVVSLGI